MRASARALLTCAAACTLAACQLEKVPRFGDACTGACGDGLACDPVRRICLPPTPPATPLTSGRSCDDPYQVGLDLSGELLRARVRITLTKDNTAPVEGSCDAERDFFVSFVVPETIGADGQPRAGAVMTATSETTAAATHLVLVDGACGETENDLCASRSDGAAWLDPLVRPGAHLLRVRIADALDMPLDVELSLRQVRCPPGFLPTTDAQCFGFVPVRGPSARVDHTASPLRNGAALVAGGRDANGTVLQDAYVFDAAVGEFFYSSMTSPRAGHAAAVLDEGSVALIGGRPDKLDAEVFVEPDRFFTRSESYFDDSLDGSVVAVGLGGDIAALVTSSSGEPTRLLRPSWYEGEACASSAWCEDGLMCVFDDDEAEYRCVCESSSCETDVNELLWRPFGYIEGYNVASHSRGAGALVSGPVGLYNALLVGGTVQPVGSSEPVPFDGALFLGSTESFSDLRPLTELRHRLDPRIVARGGRALIAGGRALENTPLAVVEVLSPFSNAPPETFMLATPRADFVLVNLSDDEAIAIGGRGEGESLLETTEVIHARELTSRAGPPLPFAIADAAGATLTDGTVLLVGGRRADGQLVSGGFWLRTIAPTLDAAVLGDDIELITAADTCADALPLVGQEGILSATTFSAADDYNFDDCVVFDQPGPDVAHLLELPANTKATLHVSVNVTSDVSIHVVDQCPATEDACVVAGDDGYLGVSEVVIVEASTEDRTLWVIIDSYLPDAGLQYTLTWSLEAT